MKTEQYDVAIIGAGAAGLSASSVTAAAGISTLVIDREATTGGVLRQCIHNGFGLRYFKTELTGPEFADLMTEKALTSGAKLALEQTVTQLKRLDNGRFMLQLLSKADGVRAIEAKAVMLTMGCRERNRGNLSIPGTRPSGVFTAGTTQKLLNIYGYLPGKNAVIVGSGDIGLIMARRLQWCGMSVKGVVEIMPFPSGLTRNIVQCLDDFNIPLWLEHSVVNICGKDRVEGVDIAPLVHGVPDTSRKFHVDCDTLLFSVGLVPEMELAIQAGVELNPATGGAVVDGNYETNVPGIFSAGNVLHVHDLVDFVAEEAERAGHKVLERLQGNRCDGKAKASVNSNLKYVVPSFYCKDQTTIFAFRPLIVADKCVLTATLGGKEIVRKKLQFIRPAEMISIELPGELLTGSDIAFDLQKED